MNKPIPFNRPLYLGHELETIASAIREGWISGNHHLVAACQDWFTKSLGSPTLLVSSCTHALEMAALALDIQPGDEIIMPSFTFVSTANAFALRGATIVFVDIRPDTMNMDETLLAAAITPRTRAIVPVHYAGVGCEMDAIMPLAEKHGIAVIEDAAHAIQAYYHGRPLGTFGAMATLSFHETKNFTSGEGGAIIVNDASLLPQLYMIRDKGTNRVAFFAGKVDKYGWETLGSSYVLSELNAGYLLPQLQQADQVTARRVAIWQRYYDAFAGFRDRVELPYVPDHCKPNGHLFYLKLRDAATRAALIAHLAAHNVQAVFHYTPLHSAPAGQRYGRFHGADRYTTTESQRLLRLPLFYNLTDDDVTRVIGLVQQFLAR